MRFALLSVLLIVVTAQQSGKDPIKDVCRRHKHQTCIIDSKLYIDGGLAYYGGSKDNSSIAERNTYLLWEDVSNATKTEFNFPDQYANLTKDPDVPSVSGGVLWPDAVNKLFYLFGGEYADTNEVKRRDGQGSGFTLWFYDTVYDSWNKSKRHGSQDGIRWPALGAGVVSEAGDAYYYGGYLTNTSDFGTGGEPVMQNGLITYNMDSRQWTNQTWDETRRAEGSLHYLPASEGGMLVYFGGLETDKSNGEVSYADMSRIYLYDIANPRWYTQTATGDVPLSRRGFCSGVVWAKDKSSYNIYLFGGFGSPNGTGLGDIYVLSIPSFQWILIWPTPQRFIFPGGKGWSSCSVFRESQMIIIGGALTNTSVVDCDVPKISGQHGLLLGQENVEQGGDKGPAWWHAPMDNLTGYRVPDQIVARIGGEYVPITQPDLHYANVSSTEGNAASTVPAMGWATQDLAKYLGTTFSAQTRTTMSGRLIPTPPPTVLPPTPAPKKPNTAAIAGGVVGGLIALVAIIAVVVFCLRRRRTTKRHSQLSELGGAPTPFTPNINVNEAQKAPATSSITGTTLHAASPVHPLPVTAWRPETGPAIAYYPASPSQHASPSPRHVSADWSHAGGAGAGAGYAQPAYAYQQTYYPPPPEPDTSPAKEVSPHAVGMQELSGVRSPANIPAEMGGRSPLAKRGEGGFS